MASVSITRLKLRGLRFAPGFFVHTTRSARQARTSDGYLIGATAYEKGLCFWTVTVWRDADAMRAFRNAGAHLKAMRRLIEICNEAAYGQWDQESAELPALAEVHRRMGELGKPSKVKWPTPFHTEGRTCSERVPGGLRVVKRVAVPARLAPPSTR